MYTPTNKSVYLAAFSAALAAMNMSSRTFGPSNDPTYYTNLANVAGAFAQQFDTTWASSANTSLDADLLSSAAEAFWEMLPPPNAQSAVIPTTYSAICTSLKNMLNAAALYWAGQGITPPNTSFVGGLATIHMADGDKVASASQAANQAIRLLDAATNGRHLTLPTVATDDLAREYDIQNDCTGLFAVIVGSGAGTTWNITNKTACRIRVDSTGVHPAPGGPWNFGSASTPGTSATGGTNCVAGGANALCYGYGSTSNGDGSVCIGYFSNAVQTYGICIAAYSTQNGAGAVCIGESLTAVGSNAVCIGYSSNATADYAVALGISNNASGVGSLAIGLNANASKPGQVVHSSGCAQGSGWHAMDMYRELAGVTGNLQDRSNVDDMTLPTLSTAYMRVYITAVQTAGAAKFAAETHLLKINVQAGAMTIVRDTTIDGAGDLAAAGWSVTISAIFVGLKLRFACNPAADTVRFFARAEWAEMGNL